MAVTVLVVTFILSMLLGMAKRRKQWILPPGPRRWPIIGNLPQLSSFPHKDMAAFCRQYGSLVYLRLGNVDAITTDDPEIIMEILQKQDEVFASRPRTVAGASLTYGCRDIMLAPMGKEWKHMRRISMEHLLTTRRLDSFSQQRKDEADCMVRAVWEGCENGNGITDLRKVLEAFSMNNMTRMLLGKRLFGVGDSSPSEAGEFMQIMHECFYLAGFIYVGDYLPFWRWIDLGGFEKRLREAVKRLNEFLANVLEQHRKANTIKSGANSEGRNMDFVDVLLSLPGQDGNPHLEDAEIKALVLDMIAGGTDTSAVTNEWAMAEVIRQPRILRKVQDELDRVVGRNRMVEESDLGQLEYLRCIVRETFRMHPAGAFLVPHESVKHTKLAGYDIPAKTRIFINAHALGRNPNLWDRAEEFYPERHMTSDGKRVEISHGTDFRILPFSAGKRKCPGAPLGASFVLLALARLFHGFDWCGFPPGETVDTAEVFGLTMPKAHPLLAIAKPRLPSHLYMHR